MGAFTDLLGQPDPVVADPITTPATLPPAPQRSAFRTMMEGPSPQDAALGSNLAGAAATTPDAHQKAVDIGNTIGAPADSVASNMPESEKLARIQRYRDALNDAPKMQQLLAEDPDLAKLSADDLDKLGKTESTLGKILSAFYGTTPGVGDAIADTGQSVPSGFIGQFGSGLKGIADINDVLGRTAERGLRAVGLDTAADILTAPVVPWWLSPSGILREPGKALKDLGAATEVPQERQNIFTDVGSGVGQVAGQIATALIAGPEASMAMLFGQGADQLADRVDEAGKSGTAEGDAAIIAGAGITAITEHYGLEALLNRVPPAIKNGILRQIADIAAGGGIEASQEVVEGILQNLAEKLLVNPDAEIFQGWQQDATAAGGTGAFIRALVNAATRGRQLHTNVQRQRRAGQDAATIEALVTGTADSKLRDRNPDAFARVMAAQTQGTPVETFYVPAERIAELYQNGTFDDDPLNQIDGLREQYHEALAVGGDVEISAADYLTHIAPTDLHGKLKDDLRASRDGWSVNDAKAYAENPQREAELAALVERLALQDEGAAVGQTVFDDTYRQLMDTGQYQSHQAAAQATLVRERYLTRAARLGNGSDADALYLRDQVRVHGPGALARVQRGDLDLVIARLKSGETVTADKTPVLDIVRKAGGVKIGSQLDQEMRAMGLTPKTHPGLFKKTGGIGDVDNFVLSEHDVLRDNGVPESGNGYADRDAVLEALRREAGGGALLTQDQRQQQSRLDEPVAVLAEQMEAAGLDPATMTADEIKAWATGQQHVADGQGALLQAPPVGSDAFDRWFGDSKVVDADGKPLVVYHTTTQDFEAFDPQKAGRTSIGLHFGTAEAAGAIVENAPDGARTLPVFVRAENPLRLPDPGRWNAPDLQRAWFNPDGTLKPGVGMPAEMAAELWPMVQRGFRAGGEHPLAPLAERHGFDSIVYDNQAEGGGDSYIVFHPEQVKSVFNRGPFDPTDPRILYQSVYHGSPHIFDRFSTAAIGTGEGAQVFGFGLYFASKKEIAKHYREALAQPVVKVGDRLFLRDGGDDAGDQSDLVALVAREVKERYPDVAAMPDPNFSLDRAIEYLFDGYSPPGMKNSPLYGRDLWFKAATDVMDSLGVSHEKSGRLYTVEIPDDGEYLLYDKPLSEQPDAVKAALESLGIQASAVEWRDGMALAGGGVLRIDREDGRTRYFLEQGGHRFSLSRSDVMRMVGPEGAETTGERVYRELSTRLGSDRAASEALLAAGVRGIKYLDASARDSSGDSFNYVVFADSDAVIHAYEQSAAGGARGSYQRATDPYGNPANIIKLTQSADLSTALHEFGHFYLFQLIDDATLPGATDEARGKLQADLQAILDHVGVKIDVTTATADQIHAVMTRDAHELWARSFEVYLREGKAPSSTLRDAFASFSAWLTRIYKTLKAIPDYRKNLTPEVRGVMDRLLATDEAIKDAQNASSFRVPGALRSVMTAAEQRSLERLTEQANREAKEDLLKRVMREMDRERTAWWKEERAKVRTEVEAEVRNRPVYRAYNIIRSGTTADGGQLVDENGTPRAMKLDRKTLERDYGKDVIKLLPKGLTAKDGASHHVVAGLTGFGSADEMRDGLMNFRPMKEVVEEETDAAMKARHGDMLSGLAEDAAKVVLNEKQLELAALQAKALRRLASSVIDKAAARTVAETGAGTAAADRARVAAAQADVEAVAGTGIPAEGVAGLSVEAEMAKATAAAGVGQRGAQQAALRQTRGIAIDIKAIQAAAKRAIAGKRVEDAVPGKYRAQADRLGRKIEEAIAKRDYETAATLKEQQLVNLALAREAQEAQAKVEKAVTRFARLRKPDSKLAAATDVDFVGAARAILSVFGLSSPQVGFDQQVWFQRLAEDDPAGAADMRAMIDAATAGAGQVAARGRTRTRQQPGGAPVAMGDVWRQMTVDEFGSLTDTVDAILSMGRDARSVQIEGERLEIKAAVGEMLAQASGRDTGKRIGQTEAVTDAEKRARSFWGTAAFLERTESWARRMDDGKVGPFTKYLVRPVLAAVYEYREQKTKRIKQLVDILEPRKKELLGKPLHATELNYTFANKGALLHAILHSGNESNFRKLLLGGRGQGFAWGKAMPDGTVDRSRWDSMIRRFVQEGVLTKADFDTAQQIWDLLEELKGPAQIAHRKMKGYYFNEVEVTGIDTPFGKYRGGYVPAVSDKLLNPEAGARVDANAMGDMANAGILPSVAKGFTKSRVEYNQPLELNISRLTGHMDTVLKFTHLGPTVRDVTRLAINREFRQEMFGIDAHAIDEVLVPWLQRVARQTVEIPFTSEGARTFGKVFKTLQRNTGIAAMAGNILNAAQQITGLSVAMVDVGPHRVLRGLVASVAAPRQSAQMIMQKSAYMRDRMDNATHELMTTLDDLLTDKGAYRKLKDKADKHGYFAQAIMQNLVDRAIWLGSYEQNTAKGMTEDEAVLKADSIVRTTQGSFAPEDVSRVEVQNAFARPFVQFYSYFNAQYNFLRTEFDSTVRELGWVGGSPRLFYVYLMGVMIPAVLADAMTQAATGQLGGGDDDDGLIGDIGEMFALSQLRYFAAMVPGVGTAMNFGLHLLNDKPYDDRLSVAPVVSQVERLGGSAIKLAEGKESTTGRAIQDALLLISMLTGLPLAQAGKPLGYVADVITGEQEGETVGDWLRGTLSGREKPKQ
jgi:hypothetical protein